MTITGDIFTKANVLQQVIAAKPSAAFDGVWGGFFINGDFFTKIVYDGL